MPGLSGEGGSPRPLVPPIHLSVAYEYDLEALESPDTLGVSEVKYSRENNPTTMMLEEALARLEGGSWALAFNSGMAALAAVMEYWLHNLKGRVVVERLTYGSTRTLARLVAGDRLVLAGPPWDELLHAADRSGVRLVLVETIANPTLRVAPIDELARVCGERGDCLLVADNTMATPVLSKPLLLGAGLVVESLTKYIIGYNDALGGSVAGRDREARRILWVLRKLFGSILQAFEAYQTIRGLESLETRVETASRTALEVARWLEESGLVEKVYYPGLESHPDHDRASRLLSGGYGGVVSFDVGSADRALRLLRLLKTIKPAPSFGAVQPLASYPYASSHRDLPREERESLGITPGLIRLSVGLASPQSIVGELEEALRSL